MGTQSQKFQPLAASKGERRCLSLSSSLVRFQLEYPAAGLERPVYIGLEIYWTPGLSGTANSHWLMSSLQSGKAGTLPSASLMWGRGSLEAAASLLLELLRADWPSAHPGSVARQEQSLNFYWPRVGPVFFSLFYTFWEEREREEPLAADAWRWRTFCFHCFYAGSHVGNGNAQIYQGGEH